MSERSTVRNLNFKSRLSAMTAPQNALTKCVRNFKKIAILNGIGT